MVCLMPGNEPGGQTLMALHVYNKFTNTKYSWKKIHVLQKPLGVIQEVGGSWYDVLLSKVGWALAVNCNN